MSHEKTFLSIFGLSGLPVGSGGLGRLETTTTHAGESHAEPASSPPVVLWSGAAAFSPPVSERE
jgi:hypothetical protein